MLNTFLTDYLTFCVAFTQFALVMTGYALLTSWRTGGLTFWRVGKLGGSVYVSRRHDGW